MDAGALPGAGTRGAEREHGAPGLRARAPSTPITSFEPGFSQAPPTLQLAYESVDNEIGEAEAARRRRAAGSTVTSLLRAGVPIVAGTDGTVPGVSLLRSLELFVEAGLTPAQALHTATLGAAEALGVSAQVGSIEVGKVADLIVIDGDPLTEISALRRLHRVVAAGRLYDPGVFARQSLSR